MVGKIDSFPEMSMYQRLLYKGVGNILAKNKKFIGRHKGDSCYIFATGHSIRYMDLTKLPQRPSIGLNFFCVHKNYADLNILYHAIPQPFFFYPYFRTTKKTYTKNIMAKLFLDILKDQSEIDIFTSLSNIFGRLNSRTYFMHHFGYRTPDKSLCDISGINSFMHAGLNAAVGLAINLGFHKAYLIGCDYLFEQKKSRHFFSHGPAVYNPNQECVYPDLLRESKELIDLEVITDEGGSAWLPSQSYKDFTGVEPRYQDNIDIVPSQYLNQLHKSHLSNQLLNSVYPRV